MTKKEEFIAHISTMNTKSLETILVKNAFKRYANVSFLDETSTILKEFF